MKKLNFLPLLLALACIVFVSSCNKDDNTPKAMNANDVNPSLIIGKWKNDQNPNFYKKYTTESSGKPDDSYFDGSDWTIGETTEDQDGTEFYYKIEGNVLREQYPNMSIYLPRVYTLMALTERRLQYFDQYNEVYSFTKQ